MADGMKLKVVTPTGGFYDGEVSMVELTTTEGEIGTPFCVTYDFDSEEDGAVTVRDRDTMEQERVKIEDLKAYFEKKFEW